MNILSQQETQQNGQNNQVRKKCECGKPVIRVGSLSMFMHHMRHNRHADTDLCKLQNNTSRCFECAQNFLVNIIKQYHIIGDDKEYEAWQQHYAELGNSDFQCYACKELGNNNECSIIFGSMIGPDNDELDHWRREYHPNCFMMEHIDIDKYHNDCFE